jgi:hypothetical protein
MAKPKKDAAKARSRKSSTKLKTRKSATAKTKPRRPVTKAKSVKRVAKTKARKAATRSISRKAAKKTTSRKSAKRSVQPSAESPTAMRLTFSYQGDRVKLVSQQPVEMTVPPSDPLKGYEQHKGFWAELKSDQDKTLFRRVLHNPTRNDAEVFSDDPEQSISRAPAPKRKGVFVVVVPHTEEGREVTLSRSSGNPDIEAAGAPTGMSAMRSLATGPATEIARFKLKK